jgi:hypothetical protein
MSSTTRNSPLRSWRVERRVRRKEIKPSLVWHRFFLLRLRCRRTDRPNKKGALRSPKIPTARWAMSPGIGRVSAELHSPFRCVTRMVCPSWTVSAMRHTCDFQTIVVIKRDATCPYSRYASRFGPSGQISSVRLKVSIRKIRSATRILSSPRPPN